MKQLSIQIGSPYMTREEYSRVSGISLPLIKKMIADGRLPIRPKNAAKEKPLINVLALFNEAAEQHAA